MRLSVFHRCPICNTSLGLEPVVEARRGQIVGGRGQYAFEPDGPATHYHLACFLVQTTQPGNLSSIEQALFLEEKTQKNAD